MGTTARTTIRLNDGLLSQAKREARRRGQTFTGLVAEGLRLVMARRPAPAKRRKITLTVSSARGGLQPGVSLDDMKTVWDRLDGIR